MNWLRNIFGPNPQLDPELTEQEAAFSQHYYQMRYAFFTRYPTGWIDAHIDDNRIVTIALRNHDDLEVPALSQGMSGHPNTVRAQQQAFLMACQHLGVDIDQNSMTAPRGVA